MQRRQKRSQSNPERITNSSAINKTMLLKPFRLYTLKYFAYYLYDLCVLWWLTSDTLSTWHEKNKVSDVYNINIAIHEKDINTVWRHRDKMNSHLYLCYGDTTSQQSSSQPQQSSQSPSDTDHDSIKRFIVYMKKPPILEQLNIDIEWDVLLNVYTFSEYDDVLYLNGTDKYVDRDIVYPIVQCNVEDIVSYVPSDIKQYLKYC